MHIAYRKIGAAILVVTALGYVGYRLWNLSNDFSSASLLFAVGEISAIALVIVESFLLSSSAKSSFRTQDAGVLLESAKNVLFNSSLTQSAQSGGTTKIETKSATATSYGGESFDSLVFVEDATTDELRRCFLSMKLIDDIDNVYVYGAHEQDLQELTREFDFHTVTNLAEISATTSKVLVCRGRDVLYPDVCKIARTYDLNESVFLELKSAVSDEQAFGEHGIITSSNKRHHIREALATRGLSPWSPAPAIVTSDAMTIGTKARSSRDFFKACERNGIHGVITEEITSEEVSHEQTVSEIARRGEELKYFAGAWRNKYAAGKRAMGWLTRVWSVLLNLAIVRRIATVAVVLTFVLAPKSFGFVDSKYVIAGAIALTAMYGGTYLLGDRRNVGTRIREYYYDVEAGFYNVYKSLMNSQYRISGDSLVKKLPAVSAMLIIADAVLVYRVLTTSADTVDYSLSKFAKSVSLFSGYLLIVSLLIGLGMVVVRQSRTNKRREISRGANLDSEPVAMVDLSPGGAGCVSVMAKEPGSIVEFESSLPFGNENTRFKCRAKVKSCVEWNDSFRIGLEFVDLTQEQIDVLETYCSVIFPHAQARDSAASEGAREIKMNGKAEKRFLSYAASFIALGAIIYSNLSVWL